MIKSYAFWLELVQSARESNVQLPVSAFHPMCYALLSTSTDSGNKGLDFLSDFFFP